MHEDLVIHPDQIDAYNVTFPENKIIVKETSTAPAVDEDEFIYTSSGQRVSINELARLQYRSQKVRETGWENIPSAWNFHLKKEDKIKAGQLKAQEAKVRKERNE